MAMVDAGRLGKVIYAGLSTCTTAHLWAESGGISIEGPDCRRCSKR